MPAVRLAMRPMSNKPVKKFHKKKRYIVVTLQTEVTTMCFLLIRYRGILFIQIWLDLTAAIPAVHHIGRSPGFPSSRLCSAPLCQNLPGMRFAAPYTSHCGHNHIIQNHQERFLCSHQCFSYAYSSQFHSKRTLPFH